MRLPDPASIPATLKTGVFAKKSTWLSVPLGEVTCFAQGIAASDWVSGRTNLYLRPVFETPKGPAYWPCLDVEAAGEHDCIAANLVAARETALGLEAAGLWSREVRVLLTGRGLRFSWPVLVRPEQAELFQIFLKDRGRWPNVDPGPYRNSFVRMAGFRGHLRQGNPLPRHVHRLEDPWGVFDLTEADYLALVAGPGEASDHVALIEAILPRGWAGPSHPWSRFLEGYRHQQSLDDSITEVRLPRSQKARRNALAAVLAHLGGLGMEPRPMEFGERTIHLLPSCPVCGAHGKAWINSSGWLRCWRSSCEAAEGLPPSAWIEGFQPEEDDMPEAMPDRGQGLPLEEARAQLRAAFDLKGDVLINATPGLGKTHAALDYLQQFCADGGKAVYAAPTHALALEVAEKARQRGIDVAHVKGMSEEVCGPHWAEVQALVQRGFSPRAMYCRRKCPQRKECSYLTQRKKAALVVTSHAALPVHEWKADLFIIDESTSGALLESHSVPWSAMESIASHLPTESRNVILAMEDCLREALEKLQKAGREHAHARLYASKPPEGQERACSIWATLCVPESALEGLQQDLAIFERGEGEHWLKWQWRLFQAGVNLHALRWLEAALAARTEPAEPGSVYLRVQHHQAQPFAMVRVQNHAAGLAKGARLVLLDGTGDHGEATGLWQREIRLVTVQARLDGLKTVWIQKGLGKGKAAKLEERQLEARLREAVKHLPEVARKVLLLTHMLCKQEALETVQRIDPSRNWSGHHHFAGRGLNAWEDHDAVVVLGTPTASPAGSLDAACALFADQQERMRWIAGLGGRDLAQGIHRIRPIRGGKTIVVMGSHWPEGFPRPGLVLDGRRQGDGFMEALARLQIWCDQFGVLTPEMAALCGVGCGPDGEEMLVRAKQLLEHLKMAHFGSEGTLKDVQGNFFDFLSTLIKYFIKIESYSKKIPLTALEVPDLPLKPILLRSNNAWSNLLAALRQETNLPDLKMTPPRRGRPWQCLGYLDAAEEFYAAMGKPWVADRWQGVRRDGSVVEAALAPAKTPKARPVPTFIPFDAETWKRKNQPTSEEPMPTAINTAGPIPNHKPRLVARLPLYPGPLPVTWNPAETRAALAQGVVCHA